MINPQILGYIRTEQQRGTDKQTITNSLLSNGWNTQDINEGFASLNSNVPVNPNFNQSNNIQMNSKPSLWVNRIPKTNYTFLVFYLLLVFGLDLYIIINDKSLIEFWYMMLAVLAVYFVFFFLEISVFSKKFSTTSSGSDSGIMTVIVLRNILFLLNFIPFIQLIGLAGLPTVGLILLVIYIVLIVRRFNASKVPTQA